MKTEPDVEMIQQMRANFDFSGTLHKNTAAEILLRNLHSLPIPFLLNPVVVSLSEMLLRERHG